MDKKVFDELSIIDLSEKTENKKTGQKNRDGSEVTLTYLSWPWAWAEVKKRYPDAHYEIEKFEGLPYVYDSKTGYMVYTTVTIDGITHEMWLPVMDSSNKAMKAEPYTYVTGYGQYQKEKTCQAATMFDINKTIMRCLVKNLAMFGLGLYIYAGEDLPSDPDEPKKAENAETKKTKVEKPVDPMIQDIGMLKIAAPKVQVLKGDIESGLMNEEKMLKYFKVTKLEDVTEAQFRTYVEKRNKARQAC